MLNTTVETREVGGLIISREPIPPETRVAEIADLFMERQEVEALAIVEAGRPVGLACRNKILAVLFQRFGHELYGRKPILEIADPSPLAVNHRERLDQVLNQAMQRPENDIYDEIIAVDDLGRYIGLLSVKQLVIEQGDALASSVAQRELAVTMAAEMRKVSEIKDQFLANVTHELRSPVNAIIGISELMQFALERGEEAVLREKLRLLSSCAVSLRAIITNILDLSKIEAGKMEVFPEEFDLVPLLEELAATARVLLAGKPIEVRVDCGEDCLPVFTDPVKLRQVLTNLVSNAAKFTERGSIILGASREGANLLLSVCDTGVGIRPEDLDKLFVAFAQLEDAKTKRHEGTGLGLTITREMLHLLGGAITVQSIQGRGSTFFVRLPQELQAQIAS